MIQNSNADFFDSIKDLTRPTLQDELTSKDFHNTTSTPGGSGSNTMHVGASAAGFSSSHTDES